MADLKNYRPDEVSVILGAIIIEGFADGTFVSIEHDEDRFSLHVGADGQATRAKNCNKSGTIRFTLMASSASNAVLSAQLELDHRTPGGVGVVPLLIKDNEGYSLHTSKEAWIQKDPSVEYAKEPGNNEWIIRCAELINIPGGA